MAGRTYIYAISFGAHVALGGVLLAVPARVRHEIIAISMSESKPKPVVHVDPPPPPEAPKPAVAARAKAPPQPSKPVDVAPPSDATSASGDALPDFGIALSNGAGSGGIAVPVAHAAASAPATAAVKTLARATRAHVDDCDEPPAKPKLISRPTPAYTDDARAAGVSGKVRVEITVDEQGRVVSVRVLQGLGHGLDEAAVAAARAMTFEPGLRCGKPSAATFKVGFNFSPGTP